METTGSSPEKLTLKPSPEQVIEARVECGKAIKSALEFCGKKVDPDYLVREMSFLADELVGPLRSFDLSRLQDVIKKGVRGEYGEFNGWLGTQVYVKWIRASMVKQKPNASISEWGKYRDQHGVQKEITPEEAEQLMKQAVDTCYIVWDRTGKVNDIGGSVFDYFHSRKVLKCSKELFELRRSEVIHRERARIQRLIDWPIVNRNEYLERKNAQDLLTKLEDPENANIKAETKRLILAEWFEEFRDSLTTPPSNQIEK